MVVQLTLRTSELARVPPRVDHPPLAQPLRSAVQSVQKGRRVTAPMAEKVKRIDQQRHELKALRFLLQFHPESLTKTAPLPRREDFQIPDCQQIYDALTSATTRDQATEKIRALDVDETDIDSF